MGVNVDTLRQRQAEYNRKSDITAVKGGDTVYYIHPPCREDDKDKVTANTPFLRMRVHYGVGANNNMCVCLDEKRNPTLAHPFVREYLKKRGVDATGGCPVCAEISKETIDPDLAQKMRPQFKYVWGVTPIKYRVEPQHKFENVAPEPSVIMTGKTVYEGIMELFYDNGDITDPTHVILAQVRKTGKGPYHTKYTVTAENASLKKPLVLPGKFANKIKEAAQDKCELFRVVADMVRSAEDVQALFSGVPLEEEKVDDMDVGDGWGLADDPADAKEKQDLDAVMGAGFDATPDANEDAGDWGVTESAASSDDDTLAMLEEEINGITG